MTVHSLRSLDVANRAVNGLPASDLGMWISNIITYSPPALQIDVLHMPYFGSSRAVRRVQVLRSVEAKIVTVWPYQPCCVFVPATFHWDELGDGDWNSGHWTGGDPGEVPDDDNPAVVTGNTVTVAADAGARTLTIEGNGRVVVPPGNQLSVTGNVDVHDGTIELGVGSGLNSLGEINMGDGSLLVCEISEDANGTITAFGDSSRVLLDAGSTLQLKVDEGSMFKAGDYLLILASQVEGTFGSVGGLGDYVSESDLTYSELMVTLTIGHDPNPGDANLDTKTNVLDFNEWNANKFKDGTTWQQGDFTGDGKTNVLDFNVWNEHKFTSAMDGGPLVAGQVPEPSSIVLLAAALTLAIVGWRCRERRNRSGVR